jgi:hypothetical protein
MLSFFPREHIEALTDGGRHPVGVSCLDRPAMIIQVQSLLSKAHFAGFIFDDVILNSQNELVFIRKTAETITETNPKELSPLLHALLDEYAKSNLEIDLSVFHASNVLQRMGFAPLPKISKEKQHGKHKAIVHNEKWQDINQFARIVDEIITVSENHTFVKFTPPDSDPRLASNNVTPTEYVSMPKAQEPSMGPTGSTATETVPIDQHQNVVAELSNAQNIVKKLRKRVQHAKRPERSVLEKWVEETRKKNGTINYVALAKLTGNTDKTIKSWLIDLGIK